METLNFVKSNADEALLDILKYSDTRNQVKRPEKSKLF